MRIPDVGIRGVHLCLFFFSSRRRHTRCSRDWSSDVCSSDLFDVAWVRAMGGGRGAWRWWLLAGAAGAAVLGAIVLGIRLGMRPADTSPPPPEATPQPGPVAAPEPTAAAAVRRAAVQQAAVQRAI